MVKAQKKVASPECTNHSCAKGSRPRCEESKETAFQVTRFAIEFKPKWIIIENVIQIRSWIGHQKLLEELWESGYFIKEQILNAQDFGVPQSRKRLFLLCSLSGEAKKVKTKKTIPETAGSIISYDSEYSERYKKLFRNAVCPPVMKEIVLLLVS